MCYFSGLKINDNAKLLLLDLERDLLQYDIENLVNDGFAYGQVPVIVSKTDCRWDIVKMEWGFIPHYITNRDGVEKFRRGYTDEKGRFRQPMTTLNAIGEELLSPGKMYRNAALKRRCLFLASCFYEWRHVHPIGKKGTPLKTAVKYPYCITNANNNDLFLIAGVWQTWTDRDTGETVDTAALVTTEANTLMEQIHNTKRRMPTILPYDLAGEWISDGLSEERISELATHQFSAGSMKAWPIYKDFKTSSSPFEAYAYQELPPLLAVQ